MLVAVGMSGYLIGKNAGIRISQKPKRQPVQVETTKPPVEETLVAVYFLKTSARNMSLQPVLHWIEKNGVDPHRRALEELIAGPKPDSKLEAPFPKNTRILGLTIKNGLAEVNLSREATHLNVGAEGEALVIASLVNTLTKFPDVYRVKILVEGEEVESLAGHVDLTMDFGYRDQNVERVPIQE
jgi:spore germination protein GerM